uniref:ZIP Zinc transporter n=1 Tax=Colletotrichum fructicola (strain Nara gc5) TaxID=1213859 RepID=L2GEX3_COLFN
MGDTGATGAWARDAASWASIPTEFLLAELSKRHGGAMTSAEVVAGANATKPQCGSSKKESYDTPLHIGALILILALSTISRIAALSVVALESYLATRGAGHSHSHSHEYEYWDEEDNEGASGGGRQAASNLATRRGGLHRPSDINLDNMESTQGLMAGASPLPSSTPTKAKANSRLANERDSFDDDASDIDLDIDELDPATAEGPRRRSSDDRPKITVTPGAPQVVTEEEQSRLLRQCLLLEGGILFHSVFIGMAISVATGPTFIVFLIAISFHQTFEGAVSPPSSSPGPQCDPGSWFLLLEAQHRLDNSLD